MLKNKRSPLVRLLKAINENNYNQKKFLLGQVLTVIDSCISDKEQRKATKDILNQLFWSENYYFNNVKIISQFVNKYINEELEAEYEKNERLDYFLDEKKVIDNQNYFPEV